MSSREAALALGVSVDTVRRMGRDGRIVTVRDARNWRLVPVSEIERLSGRPVRKRQQTRTSARNHLSGIVRSIEISGVMALVELEAGPFYVTAAITRDSVQELGLAPGLPATAIVKATEVMIELSRRGDNVTHHYRADPDLAKRAVGIDAGVGELDLMTDQLGEPRAGERGHAPAVELGDRVRIAITSPS